MIDLPADSTDANPVRVIVYGVAALLLAIAAVNLLTTLLLGVRERRRDLAVLGALGASRRQLTGTVVCGGLVLAVPAVVVGLPLGAVLFTAIVRMTDNADGADIATLPSWLSIAVALPVALAAVAPCRRSPLARPRAWRSLPRCAPSSGGAYAGTVNCGWGGVLPLEVVNAGDRWSVAELSVRSPVVVVADRVSGRGFGRCCCGRAGRRPIRGPWSGASVRFSYVKRFMAGVLSAQARRRR